MNVRASLCCAVGLFVGCFAHAQPREWCNGADFDGDGVIDEGFECRRGAVEPCVAACETGGERRCSDACTWGDCVAVEERPPEVCDGADNDCDGLADEDFDCPAGVAGACQTEGGQAGVGRCGPDCRWSVCEPAPGEYCNGRDDDGDGDVDEGFECRLWTTSACGPPHAPGIRQCTAACAWGACQIDEVCNDRDDNGNGLIDEGVDYVDLAARRLADGDRRGFFFTSARCTEDRVVVLMRRSTLTHGFAAQVFRADGTAVSRAWSVCTGFPTMRLGERPLLVWMGDEVLSMCSTENDGEILLQRFSQSGEPLSPEVRRDHVRYAPFSVEAEAGTIAISYTQMVDGVARVVLEELTPNLTPLAGPIDTGVVPVWGEGLRYDAINADLLHDDVGTEVFITTYAEGTTKYRVDFESGSVERHFHVPDFGIGRPHRFGDGYAFYGGWGVARVVDAEGQLIGTSIIVGGDLGVESIDGALTELEREAPVGVSGDQFHVVWPLGTYTRISRDGRWANSSLPHFNGDIPQEIGGLTGCVLRDGPMVLIWNGAAHASWMRWLSVFGCPAEGRDGG